MKKLKFLSVVIAAAALLVSSAQAMFSPFSSYSAMPASNANDANNINTVGEQRSFGQPFFTQPPGENPTYTNENNDVSRYRMLPGTPLLTTEVSQDGFPLDTYAPPKIWTRDDFSGGNPFDSEYLTEEEIDIRVREKEAEGNIARKNRRPEGWKPEITSFPYNPAINNWLIKTFGRDYEPIAAFQSFSGTMPNSRNPFAIGEWVIEEYKKGNIELSPEIINVVKELSTSGKGLSSETIDWLTKNS